MKTIEVKLVTAKNSLPALIQTRGSLIADREKLEEQIASLNRLIADFSGSMNGNSKKPRLRKGQAFSLIKEAFEKLPVEKGLTLKAISEMTSVGSSSAFRVLTKNTTHFSLDKDTGLWRLKRSS